MSIRFWVARNPRLARATLPGSRWIMMNVRIRTPTTTATAWPIRRSRYAVTSQPRPQRSSARLPSFARGEVPVLRVEAAGERVQRRVARQVALVHLDERRVGHPQPGQLLGGVVLVGVEGLGTGAVLGGVDQAVHLRVGVPAQVVDAPGVEEARP